MNENGKFALLVAGVGVGGFVACAGVALVLKLVASPTMTVTQVGPLTTEVAPAFSRVRVEDIKPGDLRRSAINNAGVNLRLVGYHVSQDLIAAAYDDGPHEAFYTNYASLDRVGNYSDADSEAGVPRDLKAGCFAMRAPTPPDAAAEPPRPGVKPAPKPVDETPTTIHMIIRYDATHYVPNQDEVPLETWVASGCAQAVHDAGRVISQAGMSSTMSDMMPKTPQFDEPRRMLSRSLLEAQKTEQEWKQEYGGRAAS